MDKVKIKAIDDKSPYLQRVIELGDNNQETLGFFPKGAFIQKAAERSIIVATNARSKVLGYLMYGISRKNRSIKLIHLCIDEQYRGQKITRKLLENLKKVTQGYQGISLYCRRDYQIDPMWMSLGFVSQGEKPAKTSGKFLTHWWLDYGQLNLFSHRDRELTESSLCVVIDIAIFEALCFPKEQCNLEVQSLLANWLEPYLTLCITDEVSYKINNEQNNFRREKLYGYLSSFTKLDYSNFDAISSDVLNFCQQNNIKIDRFDLRHLIKTIASESQIFLTQNTKLLNLRDKIYDRFQLSIKTPTELVSQFDKLNNKSQYKPVRLAGTQLNIIRVGIGRETKLVKCFRDGETIAKFSQKIRRFITESDRFECRAIYNGEELTALCVYGRHNNYELEIPLLRIEDTDLTSTLAYHLIYEATLISAKENRQFTRITDSHLSAKLIEAIQQENTFNKVNNTWLRANFAVVDTKDNLATRIISLTSSLGSQYNRYHKIALSLKNNLEERNNSYLLDIERLFFPAKIRDAEIPTFIVPIKPYWAQQLFDANLSNQTLFGANKAELALNKEAVYYKSNSGSRLLKQGNTGRILWYISSDRDSGFTGINSIRACSILEEVVIGKPLDLYRRFRDLGIYTNDDILKVAKGDINKDIMALRFSHTELFRSTIAFHNVREIVGKKITMVNATFIDKKHFASIYILGMNKSSSLSN